MPTIYIRADGNSRVGTGHIMRCMSIADEIKNQGCDCTFITADNECIELIEENNFRVICINSLWNNLSNEIDGMLEIILKNKIKVLLIDSYFVTERYMSALKAITRLVYIDDLNLFTYSCDILINYTNYYNKFNYTERYKNTRLLLGCAYAPLRAEFSSIKRKKISIDTENVLITTGGTDEYNISEKLAEIIYSIKGFQDITLNIICGRFNNHINSLKQLKQINNNIIIIENAERISEIMLKADLAVSAGGTTLYELCACGTPTVCFTLADNQLDNAKSFALKGALLYAGDIRNDGLSALNKIIDGFLILKNNPNMRTIMSGIMQNMIDGKGAKRIANELIELFGDNR